MFILAALFITAKKNVNNPNISTWEMDFFLKWYIYIIKYY